MNSNTNTTGAIDFRTLPDFLPSMCIPRVYPNISEGRIRKIFDELNIGVIERVDIISKTTEKGERFNRVFIHMDRWFHNSNASVARERLLGGKDIKVVYDDPWFWKISAYKPSAGGEGSSNNNNNNNKKKKATIQFDSSDEEKEKNKEIRQPKVSDIKPLLEPRPKIYNNNNARKVKRDDIETQREVRPPIREERRPPIREDRRPPIREVRPPIIKEEKPVVIEERKPIVRDNTPKIEVPPPVQYDDAVIASTKKRVIIIKK
jgi:hypothetical protein